MKKLFKISRISTWRNGTWGRDLALSFVGTTLSIILTFGTAHVLDEQQKKADGRQTAMMIIHDMDNSEEAMRDLAKMEEKYFDYAQYVLQNKNRIEDIGIDTIIDLIEYLTQISDVEYHIDDANERLFLSSQDVWKNINNPSFIDAVQQFFYERRVVYNQFNSMPYFRRPITNEKRYHSMLKTKQYIEDEFEYLKQHLNDEEVTCYLACSHSRKWAFNSAAEQFRMASNSCKFMIGISDEELKEYVANRTRRGKRLTEHKLIGSWQDMTTINYTIIRLFNNDHSYKRIIKQELTNSLYSGHVDFEYYQEGSWSLQGDSIILLQNPIQDFTMDHSHITVMPDNVSEVDKLLMDWEQRLHLQLDAIPQETMRNAFYASIDDSGDKIELRWLDKDDKDKESKKVEYLVRNE